MPEFTPGTKIFVAGHRGLVGSALLRQLANHPYEILTADKTECDLRDAAQVSNFFKKYDPEIVLLAAAKVGGIKANHDNPVEFLSDNLLIAQNVIHEAYRARVKKLVFLGSSCIYPKHAEQPISEDSLMTGALEPTNEAYAIAKIAGLKLCQYYRRQYGCDFISVMPCNLYGPNDYWNDENAHVIPSLISRFHHAKTVQAATVTIWGTGRPSREFLHVDDAARGILHCLFHYSAEQPINLGSGHEISISQLAGLIAGIVGYHGDILFDSSKPDGTLRKLLDNSKINALGFKPALDLENGLRQTYRDFLQHQS